MGFLKSRFACIRELPNNYFSTYLASREYLVCTSFRVSVQGVESLGGHFATLCRKFDFYEGNTFTLAIIFIVKSLQKEQNSTNDPQSAGINVQSPQSESTPRRLTLTYLVI
jgi:hypothetical protein